jgi:DNA end-binding protein Ku
MRALWSGEIAFGLVAIPVKLYSATRDLAPRFHYLHAVCGTRIATVRRCPHCDRDVPWEEIAKGHEVAAGQFALFTKEELAELEGESAASGIDIAEFVEPGEVEPASIETSYWVGPAGRSTRSYELLRSVLERTAKVAIARVRIRTRTRLAMLRPREGRFSLDMLRFGDELVPASEVELPEATAKGAVHAAQASPRELQLAEQLVGQLTGHFDPKKHPDTYRAAVAAAVDAKVEAHEVKASPELEGAGGAAGGAAGGGQLIDLAEMLQRSLGARPARAATQQPREARAPREGAAAPRRGPKKASALARTPAPKRRRAS